MILNISDRNFLFYHFIVTNKFENSNVVSSYFPQHKTDGDYEKKKKMFKTPFFSKNDS